MKYSGWVSPKKCISWAFHFYKDESEIYIRLFGFCWKHLWSGRIKKGRHL